MITSSSPPGGLLTFSLQGVVVEAGVLNYHKPSSRIFIENAHVSIKGVAREDTAGCHQRADERNDDPSSILDFFKKNEVDEGHAYLKLQN